MAQQLRNQLNFTMRSHCPPGEGSIKLDADLPPDRVHEFLSGLVSYYYVTGIPNHYHVSRKPLSGKVEEELKALTSLEAYIQWLEQRYWNTQSPHKMPEVGSAYTFA